MKKLLFLLLFIAPALGNWEIREGVPTILSPDGTRTLSVRPITTAGVNIDWVWPVGYGISGQALVTDGSTENLSWGFSMAAHNLLGATYHGDTVTHAVTAGDIIFGNATPKWDGLAIGAAGDILGVSSGLPSWLTLTGGSGVDITNGAGSITFDLGDLTSDWTISSNNISLTSGTLTANTLTDGTATITGGDITTSGVITATGTTRALTGNVDASVGFNTVTSSLIDTLFLSELNVGDTITIEGESQVIATVTSDTTATIVGTWANSHGPVSATINISDITIDNGVVSVGGEKLAGLRYTGDTNTGIMRSGSDEQDILCGGDIVATWADSTNEQNIWSGIDEVLRINRTGATGNSFMGFKGGDADWWKIGSKSASGGFLIRDETAGAPRLIIDSSGNSDFQAGDITTTGNIDSSTGSSGKHIRFTTGDGNHYVEFSDWSSGTLPRIYGDYVIYMYPQNTLVGWFASTGFNMNSNKGFQLGQSGAHHHYIKADSSNQDDDTIPANHPFALMVGLNASDWTADIVSSRYMIICDEPDINFNFAHNGQPNPTLFIHSANQSTTEWISLAHDQTDGVISVGTGNLNLTATSTVIDGDLTVNENTTFVPSGTQNITAAGGITVTNTIMEVQGSGGAVDVNSVPQIAAGTDGQTVLIHGESDTNTLTIDNGDGVALKGGKNILGDKDTLLLAYDSADGEWQELARNNALSEKTWAFSSPTGGGATFYVGGHYDFGSTDNDFNPAINFGTASKAEFAHFFVVQAAGAGGGTDTVVTVSGDSIDDQGGLTPGDSETITVDDAGAANTYYETTNKWLGQVTITKTSGPDLLMNYGFTKYYDRNNTDFRILGFDATWLAGGNDSDIEIKICHHKTTGWTYNAGSTPTPPTPIAKLSTDFSTNDQTVKDENGAWKRDNLNETINGSGSEGVLIQVTTTAGKTFQAGNISLVVRPD